MEPTKKTKSFLEIIILEPESELIHEALGITEERQKELIDFVYEDVLKKFKSNDETSVTEDLHRISIKSKHANELAWMIFQYGTNLGYNKAMNEQNSQNSMNDFLRFLLKNGIRPNNFNQESDDDSDSE